MARGLIFLAMLGATTPAMAAVSIAIPEPSELGLFALAVIGLIIGRRSSRRSTPPRHDDDA